MSELSLFGGTNSAVVPGVQMSRSVTKATKKNTDLVLGRGEVAHTTDAVRAGLTFSALNNVGTLVGTATQLMQVAPEGATFYEACINAYAMGAANSIARFQ